MLGSGRISVLFSRVLLLGSDYHSLSLGGATIGLAAAGTASSIAGVTTVIISEIKRGYISQGYVALSPGGSVKSDKKTLSLWQQCHVIRERQSGNRVIVEETYMRPIFTGATDKSNNRHDIAFWVRKYPYVVTRTFAVQVPPSRPTAPLVPARFGRRVSRNGEHFLNSGYRLDHEQYLQAQDYILIQQTDHNLVLYYKNTAVWANNKMSSGVMYTLMQTDGNLVSYDKHRQPLWASNTDGWNGAYLALRFAGLLGVMRTSPVAVPWECKGRTQQMVQNLHELGMR
jgi:hypothetical protein